MPDTAATPPTTTPEPTTWWDLYAALATHGHHHPHLQPVEIHQPTRDLTDTYPTLIAALEILEQPHRRDAIAFADWIESLDVIHTLYTQESMVHPADTIVTAVGVIGTVTVSLWTIVRGSATITSTPHPNTAPLTVESLRTQDSSVKNPSPHAPAGNTVKAPRGTPKQRRTHRGTQHVARS